MSAKVQTPMVQLIALVARQRRRLRTRSRGLQASNESAINFEVERPEHLRLRRSHSGTKMPLASLTRLAKRQTPLQLAADLNAAVIDTSITLWWRWPILLTAGMPSRNTAELNRMVSEKAVAAASGMFAAQTETMRITARVLAGKKAAHASTAVAAAALKPALRTVKANAKRLRKKRRSRT